jgi:hypothetical protein
MRAFRIGLPAAIAVAGIVLAAAGHGDISVLGVALIGVAIVVLAANLYVRLSIASQRDRDREAAARREFTRTGRWPG